MAHDSVELMELRLFLEDICYDLLRFQEARARGVHHGDIQIRQESAMAGGAGYADIEVLHPDGPSDYLEVKCGYEPDQLLSSLGRKYGSLPRRTAFRSKLSVVTDLSDEAWAELEAAAASVLDGRLTLERLDRTRLEAQLLEYFKVGLPRLDRESLLQVRSAIEKTKGVLAFGEGYKGSILEENTLWHVGHWVVERAREKDELATLLAPGLYTDVAVVIADISGFSSYVRDTPDDAVMRYILTSFYTKARRQVLAAGGTLSQFVGDAVIALFGLQHGSDYMQQALQCAAALLDIGASVTNSWQQMIDRIQQAAGCHIGIAVGDLHLVPLRAFSRSYVGVIADSVNMASRLSSVAQPHEIVLSNAFYQRLPHASQKLFQEMAPVDAKNMGLLRAWKSGSKHRPAEHP
jgi:class 3 adenylate cyclase